MKYFYNVEYIMHSLSLHGATAHETLAIDFEATRLINLRSDCLNRLRLFVIEV